MGKRIVYCGGSGAGLSAKICNNLVLGVQQIVVAEAMLLGQKLGLDPAVLAGVINSATGSCWASSVNNPVPGSLPDKSPPCERDYEGGFNTSLMLKVSLVAIAELSLISSRIWVLQQTSQARTVTHCHLANSHTTCIVKCYELALTSQRKISPPYTNISRGSERRIHVVIESISRHRNDQVMTTVYIYLYEVLLSAEID